MAQVLKVQQVPSSPNLNGHPAEKNGNGMSIGQQEEPTSSHMQNGNMFHGTPTKDLNGAASTSAMMDPEELQLSPGDLRRRSTRASALKAQEKIKLKDDVVVPQQQQGGGAGGPQKRSNEDDDDDDEGEDGQRRSHTTDDVHETAAKKRRLEDGREFDQTCFRFGLRANDEGEVYAMTDESENSSIHDSEMEVVRFHYEKMKSREPDEEQLKERLKMRREAEQMLREEEAKLHVLKRMRESQGRAINKLAAETKQIDMEETAKAAAAAYKPGQANQKLSANGKTIAQQNANKTMASLTNLSTEQQLELLGKLAGQSPAAKQAYMLAKKTPSQTTQLFAQLITMNTHQIQKQKEAQEAAAAAAAAASASASASSSSTSTIQVQALSQHAAQNQASIHQTVQSTQQKLLNQQTPAQRITAARVSFRAQADKQLMTIPTQKSQPHDVSFLPNPNASAFPALHGLDLVVQAVLKDRSFEQRYPGPYYECEECGIDWSHTWKCMGTAPDDLHLYCEACVRTAHKKKNRMEQTAFLKRAFQKIVAQEKEFEKRISEGQLEQLAEQKAAAAAASVATTTQQIPTSSTATVSSIPLGPRINMPSSSGTSTPTHANKSSTPLASTPKSSHSASASSSSAAAKKLSAQQQQAAAMMTQMMSNQILKNPMMQQMMQAYMAQQMAAATTAVHGGSRSGGGQNNMNGVNAAVAAAAAAAANPMALIMAQAQAAMVQAQQAQALQAQREREAAQREAAQQKKAAAQELAAQQQNQQNILLTLMSINNQMTPQQIQQIRALTPAQQKALVEAVRQQNQKK